MQVVMKKCYLLNLKKFGEIRLVVFEINAKKGPLYFQKNDGFRLFETVL